MTAKSLKRFLTSASLDLLKAAGSKVCLNIQETHHLKHVLRIRAGALCLLFDQNGNEFLSRLERFTSADRAEFVLLKSSSDAADSLMRLAVAQAIPQHRKMDEIARKAAEIGVSELIPLITERTVVRPSPAQARAMIERWQRIAEQTVKQSRLSRVPKILPLTSLKDLWSHVSRFERVFLLDPDASESVRDWIGKDAFHSDPDQARSFLLVIGPEGGFSPEEIKEAKTHSVTCLRMGEGVLKTDTAFTVASGIFQCMYDFKS